MLTHVSRITGIRYKSGAENKTVLTCERNIHSFAQSNL